eukprot:821405-Karenia_brevis.AAC.1
MDDDDDDNDDDDDDDDDDDFGGLSTKGLEGLERISLGVLNMPYTTVQAQRAAYPVAKGILRHRAWVWMMRWLNSGKNVEQRQHDDG